MRDWGVTMNRSGLRRVREQLAKRVDSGEVPGLVALLGNGDSAHVEVLGDMHVGGGAAMAEDSIFRLASATKPIIAAGVLALVEDCRLRLDDSIEEWLPELADRRVLVRPDAEVTDTVPARRAITVRDLLTFTWGFGVDLTGADTPIRRAMLELGLLVPPSGFEPDVWIARLGSLPLMAQPGEKWLYHVGSDVLGLLVARVTGVSLGEFLRERIFAPLGMVDTGFFVPEDKIGRLPTSYAHDPATGELVVWDPAVGGKYSKPPRFETGGDGLVSTASDYFAFQRMLLQGGKYRGERVLSGGSVALMTSDQLTPAQKVEKDELNEFFGDHGGFGFGMGVRTVRRGFAQVGQFGWDGGLGTSAQADPGAGFSGVLLTQVALDSPVSRLLIKDFWTTAYQAMED
ncbi:serine hydrolase domain-containing protein [Crossiella cryophila]|uniref:CubicO group peptidase (Beta-lactamase class C family) n=1 Tax=Crossiella cryophila TaxID=43355 RepID=A0A7W7CAQ8_9PSEU|nr:serine hydrolase domain-containing protein [Crossiella cryophila]MBB4677537.1 CubicO group peptidase (beta-lactamase class C family) [Crossiella cryophila]